MNTIITQTNRFYHKYKVEKKIKWYDTQNNSKQREFQKQANEPMKNNKQISFITNTKKKKFKWFISLVQTVQQNKREFQKHANMNQ